MNFDLLKSNSAPSTLPDARSLTDGSSHGVDETCLQRLLEEYADAIEQNQQFDRAVWLEQVCRQHASLADELRDGANQIDALTRLAGRCVPGSTGQCEIDGYTIVRRLGHGGMGIVYEAIEEGLGRRVALKVFPGVFDSQSKAHARFMIEAQAAARLNHPNIVPIYRIGDGDRSGSLRYLAMRLIEGRSLDRVLGDNKPDLRESVRWMIDAAEAIAHAHQCGVIHRDIKPSNLLLDAENQVWVTDFGLAQFSAETSLDSRQTPLTATGDRVGTLAYMSPQQAAGQPVDERTDVYSLGLTLFELLTGRRAIEGSTAQEVQQVHNRAAIFRIRDVDPRLATDLENIVCKATAADIVDRYQSTQELADDLKRFRDGHPVLAAAPSRLKRAGKWLIRHRTLTLAVACVCLLVTAVSWATAARLAWANHQVGEAFLQSQADLQRTEEILDRFGLLAADQLRDVEGATAVRRELLKSTLTYYEDLASRIEDKPRLAQQTAITYFKAAQIIDEIGAAADARAAYEKSLSLFQSVQDKSTLAARTFGLCMNNLAVLKAEAGEFTQAQSLYQRAIDHQSAFLDIDHHSDAARVDLARTHGNYAMALIDNGQCKLALEQLEAGLATVESIDQKSGETDLTRSMLLSNLAYAVADPSSSEAINERAIAILRDLEAQFRGEGLRHAEIGRMLATTLSNRAALHADEPRAAAEALHEADELLSSIASMLEFDRQFAAQWATTKNNLGRVLLFGSQPDEAIKHFRSAELLLGRLCEMNPDAEHYQCSLAGVLHNLGRAQATAGDSDAARQSFQRSLSIQRKTLADPDRLSEAVRRTREELLQQTAAQARRIDSQNALELQ